MAEHFSLKTKRDFADGLIDRDRLLGEAIAWIKSCLSPDDVFDKSDLAAWAEREGYVQEDSDD